MSSTSSIRSCQNCEFYERDNALRERGECHKGPPIPVSNGGGGSETRFPFVRFNTWCGEFKPKEINKASEQPSCEHCGTFLCEFPV